MLLTYHGWMLESPRSQSLTTKLWFILMQIFKLRKPKLDEYQGRLYRLYCWYSTACKATTDYLPKQPVPKLKDTVKNYVTSYEGLLSESEMARLRENSEDFLSRAKHLQFKIEQKSLIEVELSLVTI